MVLGANEEGSALSPRGVSQNAFHTTENLGSDERTKGIT
jgi:hypothetical protein